MWLTCTSYSTSIHVGYMYFPFKSSPEQNWLCTRGKQGPTSLPQGLPRFVDPSKQSKGLTWDGVVHRLLASWNLAPQCKAGAIFSTAADGYSFIYGSTICQSSPYSFFIRNAKAVTRSISVSYLSSSNTVTSRSHVYLRSLRRIAFARLGNS